MRTTVHFSGLHTAKINLYGGLWQRINLLLGRLYPLLRIAKIKRANFLLTTYRTKRDLLLSGPLCDELVKEWMSDNTSRTEGTEQRKIRTHAVSDETMALGRKNRGMLQRGAALLYSVVLRNQDQISSIVNVGARIDPTMCYMAGKFPKIHCTSIDMQPNMAEINRKLPQHPNWDFIGGYACRVFSDTDFRADVVFMTSTASKINTAELDAYMAAFVKKGVKFLVFSEPWWVAPLGVQSLGLLKPENIDPHRATVAGFTGDYLHNYQAVFARHGFDLHSIELFPMERAAAGIGSHLQLVAFNKSLVKAVCV